MKTFIIVCVLSLAHQSAGGFISGSSGHGDFSIDQGPQSSHHESTHEVPVPVYQKIGVPIPHPIPVAVPQEVKVPIPQPYAQYLTVDQPIQVPHYKVVQQIVEKKVPYTVEKHVPYVVEKPYPVVVEKKYPVHIPKPYPVYVPVYKHVLHHTGGSSGGHGGWKKY